MITVNKKKNFDMVGFLEQNKNTSIYMRKLEYSNSLLVCFKSIRRISRNE